MHAGYAYIRCVHHKLGTPKNLNIKESPTTLHPIRAPSIKAHPQRTQRGIPAICAKNPQSPRPQAGRSQIFLLRHYLRLARTFFFADFDAVSLPTPPMIKSSSFLPDLSAAASHRGFSPRPAQVSLGFSGLRYFGATFPLAPRPKAPFDRPLPAWKRESLASSDSKVRRSSATLPVNTASILPRSPISASIDIDFKFIFMLLHRKGYFYYIDPAANASR